VLARSIPVIRTLAPVVAGAARMADRRLVTDVLGGLLGGVGVTVAGFTLGNAIPLIDRSLLPVTTLLVAVSLLRARRGATLTLQEDLAAARVAAGNCARLSCHALRVSIAATEPSTATPSAPPTWRLALITPEAIPDRSRSTAAMPVADTAGMVSAIPAPTRR